MKKIRFSKTNEKNSLECLILGKYFRKTYLKTWCRLIFKEAPGFLSIFHQQGAKNHQ
jgi:hypothetical protein